MTGSRLVWLCAAVTTAVAPEASAQSVSRADAADVVESHTVRLRSATPGTEWAVYSLEEWSRTDRMPLAECGDVGCALTLPEGRYRLWATSLDETRLLTARTLVVDEDLDFEVSAPRLGWARAGLATGIVGAAAFTTGVILLSGAALQRLASSDCRDGCGPGSLALTGGALLLTGAVLAPIGWVVFDRFRRPGIQRVSTASGIRLPIEVAPTRIGSGFGVGASVTF